MKNEKKSKKLDLLELSEAQRKKLIKAIKKSLEQKVAEAKLRQPSPEAGSVTLNGKMVHCNTLSLKCKSIYDRMRSL